MGREGGIEGGGLTLIFFPTFYIARSKVNIPCIAIVH